MPSGSVLSYETRLLGRMTAAQVLESKNSLVVGCEPCRITRQLHEQDVAALAAYYPNRPIRDLKFRCSRCGGPGSPSVNGWDGGRVKWE